MNIYEKLQEAKARIAKAEMKKSGHNKFAGYTYFELGDFLPIIVNIFNDLKLCSIVSFSPDRAYLELVNSEKPEERIEITSPLSSAALKGCHDVQNLGAVETYQRRYLYVALLDIVEHDALEATTGKDKPESFKSITKSVFDSLPVDKQAALRSASQGIIEAFESSVDDAFIQYDAVCANYDADEKTALWNLLPSNIRSAIKKFGSELKQKGE